MLKFADVAGAIFDVDDTLLDNNPLGESMGLHAQSRLMAAHQIGKRRKLSGLRKLTEEQSEQAFYDAREHVLHAVVWQMLVIAGAVSPYGDPDYNHPLVKEMVELKEQLHEDILRTKGREVPGASAFVALLAQNGLEGKLAVASTACRRDIDVFFEMTKLHRYFPDERIISRENFTHPKPHPEAFNLAFNALGLPERKRGHVLAFEDDPRGVMSAKAAGLYVCAITTKRITKEDFARLAVPPDLVADSFAEFAKLFDLPDTLNI